MTIYKAPLDDQRFALFDVLGAEAVLTKLQGGEGHSRDLLDAVLEEAGRLSEAVLAPTNASGDEEGCHYDKATQTVTTPKGFKEAFKAFADGGWTGLTQSEHFGGQALPGSWAPPPPRSSSRATCPGACTRCCPKAPAMRWSCTAPKQQQNTYLKPIVEGRWTGTMCLTEPQAGSDLGLLKTRAEPGEPTAATRSPAPRSSSAPASTTSPRTSSTWCWPACPTHPPAAAASRCSSCRSSR